MIRRDHRRMPTALLFIGLLLVALLAACGPVAGQQEQPAADDTRAYVPDVSRDGPLPTATPTPIPTATPTPAPSLTPTSFPTGPSTAITNGPRGSNQVALTFDMGGRVDPALDIMAFLVANDVHATIFVTGAMLENQNTDAGREVLQIVAAHPELFRLGNHSYSHADFTTLSAGEMADEIATTDAAVSANSALNGRPWFRPPYGAYDQSVLNGVGATGYAYTVLWDVDTIDWRPEADGGPTAAFMTTKVLDNAQGGTIVLMHLGGYNTLAALPDMVAGLRGQGFELVTLDEMFD